MSQSTVISIKPRRATGQKFGRRAADFAISVLVSALYAELTVAILMVLLGLAAAAFDPVSGPVVALGFLLIFSFLIWLTALTFLVPTLTVVLFGWLKRRRVPTLPQGDRDLWDDAVDGRLRVRRLT